MWVGDSAAHLPYCLPRSIPDTPLHLQYRQTDRQVRLTDGVVAILTDQEGHPVELVY